MYTNFLFAVQMYKSLGESIKEFEESNFDFGVQVYEKIRIILATIFPNIEDYLDNEDELKLCSNVNYTAAKGIYACYKNLLESASNEHDEEEIDLCNDRIDLLDSIFPHFDTMTSDDVRNILNEVLIYDDEHSE